jgi:hypothetical protein
MGSILGHLDLGRQAVQLKGFYTHQPIRNMKRQQPAGIIHLYTVEMEANQ